MTFDRGLANISATVVRGLLYITPLLNIWYKRLRMYSQQIVKGSYLFSRVVGSSVTPQRDIITPPNTCAGISVGRR